MKVNAGSQRRTVEYLTSLGLLFRLYMAGLVAGLIPQYPPLVYLMHTVHFYGLCLVCAVEHSH